MTDAERAWIAGAWSAFGLCTVRRGRPSCMLSSSSRDLPEALHRITGLGKVEPGEKWRWLVSHPPEVKALYDVLRHAPVPCTQPKLIQIDAAWTAFRMAPPKELVELAEPLTAEDAAAEAEFEAAVRRQWTTPQACTLCGKVGLHACSGEDKHD